MPKDIEEPMSEGPEQIASDLAKVVRADVFADILHRAAYSTALESTPAKNVLTECAACKMQIEHISETVVSHPINIIAKSYGVQQIQRPKTQDRFRRRGHSEERKWIPATRARGHKFRRNDKKEY